VLAHSHEVRAPPLPGRLGTLEFVGAIEKEGWSLAGTVQPIAYIAWSLWLIAIGEDRRTMGAGRAAPRCLRDRLENVVS
jgi:hypothetical protein